MWMTHIEFIYYIYVLLYFSSLLIKYLTDVMQNIIIIIILTAYIYIYMHTFIYMTNVKFFSLNFIYEKTSIKIKILLSIKLN